jgi:hypothetical protein
MYIIGDIHILSDKVKEAVKIKDAKFFQGLSNKWRLGHRHWI